MKIEIIQNPGNEHNHCIISGELFNNVLKTDASLNTGDIVVVDGAWYEIAKVSTPVDKPGLIWSYAIKEMRSHNAI